MRVFGIWVRAFYQKKLNKVEVGHVASVACIVQGRVALLLIPAMVIIITRFSGRMAVGPIL
mgnify:CR=1 FL=1